MTATDERDGGPVGTPPAAARAQQQVLQYLEDHAAEMVAALAEFVQVPSVSGSPEECSIQELLAHRLSESALAVDLWRIPLGEVMAAPDFPGVEVEREEAWGLVGRLPGAGDGPSLMLNAHVDVVPPGDVAAWREDPFRGGVDATHVRGRGSCDMKGGLVAALWAVRAIAATRVRLGGDLQVACVPGEEDGGLGTYATLARGWRADACVIPEPTSLDLVPANAGAMTFRLRIRGHAAHASRRTAGVSAVEKFWPVFRALRELEHERNRDVDPLMAHWDVAYPIEIGTVRAGDWSSSVPDLVVAEGRYGVALAESLPDARRDFEAALAAVADRDSWLRDHPVEVEWWGGQFAPGRTAADAAIVGTVARAHARTSERRQRTWGGPYGSDLRLMTGIGGIPTVHYGPGDAALAHGPNEVVPIAEMMTAARTLALVALDHCGVRD
jgi:acetylornithine deacetylase